MKTYVLITLLAISSISSVSSAMCMKKFLTSCGINEMPNTNFYVKIKGSEASPSNTTPTTSNNTVSAQR